MKKLLLAIILMLVLNSGCGIKVMNPKDQCLNSPEPRKYVIVKGLDPDLCYRYEDGKWVEMSLDVYYNDAAQEQKLAK